MSRKLSGEVLGLYAENREAGKSRSIQTIIQAEQPETMVQGVSSDEEVSENAARAGISLFSSARNMLLESASCSAPDGFIEIPIHGDTRLPAKGIKKGFGPRGGGKELREYRCGNN